MCHKRRFISGVLIQESSRRLASLENNQFIETHKIKEKFSDGWLALFKQSWNLKYFGLNGGSGDVLKATVLLELPIIQEKIRHYIAKDLVNCEESRLNFKMAPDRTITNCSFSGRKKKHSRVTFMPLCNADGSEKIPLF